MTEETKTAVVRRDPFDVKSGEGIHSIIPQDFASVYQFSRLIAASKFAPKGMEDPETISVAIMHGFEVGLTPMMALQSIAVINGRPSVWGDGALALIVSSPYFEDIEETFEGTYGQDDFTAICIVKRKGRPKPVRSEFSWAEAKEAKLLDKQGPWKEYRRRMFKMRARAFALRDAFPDVLRGLAIAEEMNDITPKGAVTEKEEPPTPEEDGKVIEQTVKEAKPARAKRTPKEEPVADKSKIEDATIVDGDGGTKHDAETGEIEEDQTTAENADAAANASVDDNPPAPDDDGKPEQTNVVGKDEFKEKVAQARQASENLKSLIPALPDHSHESVVAWFKEHNREWAKAKTLDELKVLWMNKKPIAMQDDETQAMKDMRDNHKARINAELEAKSAKDNPPAPEGAEFDFKAFYADFGAKLKSAKTPDEVNMLASDLQAEPLKSVLSSDEQEMLRGEIIERMDAIESFGN